MLPAKKCRAPREKSEQEVPRATLVLSIQRPPNRSVPPALSHIPEESLKGGTPNFQGTPLPEVARTF